MQIDHIFIFSKSKGTEADELVNFGLTEGSSRVHAGQGTTNRKFYFQNFFLEILWVHDQLEMQSERTRTTKLRERSNFESNEYSPFGLCLVNTDESDQIFTNSLTYQPEYFPDGKTIDFITEAQLPWIFRLPFKGQKKATNEPLEHPKKLKKLTRATFETPIITNLTTSIQKLSKGTINFKISDKTQLELEFDNGDSKQELRFQKLPLTIKY